MATLLTKMSFNSNTSSIPIEKTRTRQKQNVMPWVEALLIADYFILEINSSANEIKAVEAGLV
ncbi:MAG: hypothetical protein OJF59_001092 [Cytophagales bacterium]|jgi:hypothetical protein|nr:hypothetical protein [Bacteroidota bacterium]MBS1979916.1 hypothetical protein [Bacteroidota bacterium]WHZ07339.1 MAG: hypothetical protein OJF59_001092 [Cytophagales bacterium]